MTSSETIRVGVCGAMGRMGQAVVKTVLNEPGLKLVAAIDHHRAGEDAAIACGVGEASGVLVEPDLKQALAQHKPDVVVDFTAPQSVLNNILTCSAAGVHAVVGTTGLNADNMKQIELQLQGKESAVLIAPNFAIGAVLLMKFAQEASRYFEHAEIIELHHNQKLDAPSGTALRTALLMQESQPVFGKTNISGDTETYPGARGGVAPGNIHIHSVRLPGLVAHEEVIFGGVGQTLTIRHDSLDRSSFMPGVVLAVRQIGKQKGLIYGLENLL